MGVSHADHHEQTIPEKKTVLRRGLSTAFLEGCTGGVSELEYPGADEQGGTCDLDEVFQLR